MIIVLDNSQSSHACNRPITGKIKVHLTEPFDASAITLNLCGYQRSHFNPTSAADQFQASQGVTRLAKSLLSVNFVVAEFPDGAT